jgi:hypothetical protein
LKPTSFLIKEHKMKICLAILGIAFFQSTSFAARTVLYCGGDNNGSQYQFVVDWDQNTIEMNQAVHNNSMPPYPFKTVENWKLGPASRYNSRSVTVYGQTTRVTMGMAGRIEIRGTVNSLTNAVYNGEATIKPATLHVEIGTPITTFPVSCRFQ